MSREPGRIERLARRVSWLDRHRRTLSIISAIVVSPVLIGNLAEALGADWPRIHATLLSAMVGVVVWCASEVALAWLAAVWETECARLVRDRGLPRATLLTRRCAMVGHGQGRSPRR